MTDVDPASLTPGESVDPPDEAPPPPRAARRRARKTGMAALTLGALGVVFGDIGTSPLYALQTVFAADHHAVRAHRGRRLRRHLARLLVDHDHRLDQVRDLHHARRQRRRGRDHGPDRADPARRAPPAPLGQGRAGRARDLRRVAVLRRRDDHAGDLGALGGRGPRGRRRRRWSDLVVPITLVILTVLFAIQRFGTGAVGRAFGPVMGVWFAILAVAGLGKVVAAPGDPARALADLRRSVPRRPRPRGVHRARLGRAHGHRRRGAVRRHGPLRPPADPARVVRHRLPRADPQLHGPGRADPRHAARDRQPVLPALPALGADPDGPRSPPRRRSSPRRP